LARQAAEERERWVLWVPVFIGAGIAAYFGLAFEPPIWLGAGLAGAVAVRVAFRRWLPATRDLSGPGSSACRGAAARGASYRPFLTREVGRAASKAGSARLICDRMAIASTWMT
jgi:competence protein ComEC